MMSAVPMRGAASKAPSALSSTTCSKPWRWKKSLATLWYPVTTRRGVRSLHSGMLQPRRALSEVGGAACELSCLGLSSWIHGSE